MSELVKTQRRTIGEMHTDTRILINVLEREFVKGKAEFVSYKVLTDAIQRDVQKEARGLLQTARRYMNKEHGLLIDTVAKEGMKRSDDYCGAMDKTSSRVGRATRKATKEILNAIQDKELSEDVQVSVNARLSQLGAISLFSKQPSVKKLEGYIKEHDQKELPTAETLKLFA